MRAARIVEPGRVIVEEVAIPEPGPGEVRVRLEGSGVSASSLGPYEGLPFQTYPMQPGGNGHEGWGTIDMLGTGVAGPRHGERVVVLSDHAYAEYDVAQASAVVPIPDELEGMPCPGDALGRAMNVFERSNIEPGQTVAVVGIGFLGAILTRLARDVGARVICISRRPFARDLALQMGAHATLPMTDAETVVDATRALTGGALCDRVIEAVGEQGPLDLAAELTRERGTLVIAGYHQHGLRRVDMRLWNRRGFDVVNAHDGSPIESVEGVRRALSRVKSGRLDPGPLITHRFGLHELGTALDALRARPDGFLKAIVQR